MLDKSIMEKQAKGMNIKDKQTSVQIRAANGSVTHGSMGQWVTFLGWVNGSWVTCHGS